MENVNPVPNLITQDIEKNCDISLNNNDNNNKNKNIFWLDDFNILFEEKNLYNLWPREDMTRIQKLNAITRLVMLFTLIGSIFFQNTRIFVTGVITIIFIIATKYILDNKYNSNLKEEKEIFEKFSNEITYQRLKHNFSNPTQQNPVMNTLLPEIVSNPKKLAAAPSYNTAVKEEINNSVKEMILTNIGDKNLEDKLFDNLGNNIPSTLDNSMRQFYTTPNTLIPNNQKDFAKFCYGNMAKCKDGEIEKCLIRNNDLNN